MAKAANDVMPRLNPCAQCGKPIALPDWIEQRRGGGTAYLWHCWACDYRFEAVAYYSDNDQDTLAA